MKNLLIIGALAAAVAGCSPESDPWNDPVIPVSIKGIEAVNIDNSGKLPVISSSSIKKEAYMVGVKWIMDNTPSDDDDKFITGPIREGYYYGSLPDTYSKAIKCNTQFNSDIPAGRYISRFFKEIDRNYLPSGVDEGFVLLVAPDPGEHSFRVEYYDGDELKFFYDTQLIRLF